MHDKILILDFGSQVTQLIARRVREAHVYCEIHPCDVDAAFIREFAPRGIILSGSHMSAYGESTDRAPQLVFELGVPVLGICYGMQTMAQQLGGRVEGGHQREFGYAEVRARGHTRLLDGIEDGSRELAFRRQLVVDALIVAGALQRHGIAQSPAHRDVVGGRLLGQFRQTRAIARQRRLVLGEGDFHVLVVGNRAHADGYGALEAVCLRARFRLAACVVARSRHRRIDYPSTTLAELSGKSSPKARW